MHGSVATGEGLGDGVGLAAVEGVGDVDEAVLVVPHAHSTTSATRAVKRMRGTIAGRWAVFRILTAVAGELSPDRLYYWDGGRWVSALSPDGAWRWDGSSWRPAGEGAPRPRSSRVPWLIAGGTIVALVAASVGVYFAVGFVMHASERVLPSGGLAPCNSALAEPGAALSEGKSLCGGTLGSEYILADCTLTEGTPAGIEVWKKSYKPTEGDWAKTTINTSSDGCNLSAPPDADISFDTAAKQPPTTVVIADFTYTASAGSIGVQLACSQESSCVDLTMFQEGLYSLHEGRPNDGWDTLTKGVAFGVTFRAGTPNRMILRLNGKHVSVYLNGKGVTQADTSRVQTSGYVDFYLDNRGGPDMETVWLQRLYVFESR